MTRNEILRIYYATATGSNVGTLQDLERKFLLQETGLTGTTPDLWMKYLLGLGYSGTLSEMYNSWLEAEVYNPELVPLGNWQALSGAILSEQTDTGFRAQSAANDSSVMVQKTITKFVVGETYRIIASAVITSADQVRLRVSTQPVSQSGNVIDDIKSNSFNWNLTFVATNTTLNFGGVVTRAAFSADATFSNFSIRKA